MAVHLFYEETKPQAVLEGTGDAHLQIDRYYYDDISYISRGGSGTPVGRTGTHSPTAGPSQDQCRSVGIRRHGVGSLAPEREDGVGRGTENRFVTLCLDLLPSTLEDDDLRRLLQNVAGILDARIIRNAEGQSLGFAIVYMATCAHAERMIEA